MELPPDAPKPRLCHIIKWPDFDGYGFNLHAEKSKNGQYIGKVDDESPAMTAGLREGDKIVEVNGVNISNENHRQVVERIKAIPNETKLLVVEEAAEKWYKEKKITVRASQPNVLYMKTPVPRPKTNNADSVSSETVNEEETDKSNLIINNNNNNNNNDIDNKEKIVENGTSKVAEEDNVKDASGHSSQQSTPKSVSKSSRHPSDAVASTDIQVEIVPVSPIETTTTTTTTNRPPSSGGSSVNTGSIPGSPVSTKSSAPSNSGTELNLNMSASEMRQLLAQRKKNDPKKIQMDLRQKYEIIQQM